MLIRIGGWKASSTRSERHRARLTLHRRISVDEPLGCRLDTRDSGLGRRRLGCLLGYAELTDIRVLALVGHRRNEVYEIFFGFSSSEGKERFLKLVRSNEDMGYSYVRDEFIIPTPVEIQNTRPLATIVLITQLRESRHRVLTIEFLERIDSAGHCKGSSRVAPPCSGFHRYLLTLHHFR
jgi:hypothetical protein